MKRSHVLVITCICTLAIALFGLTACGGGSSSSASTSKSAGSSSASSSSAGTDVSDPNNLSEDDIKAVFEQVVASMSEFYKGTTPVGEQLYYAGGADGANAIFALVVPESNESAIFVGPATVGDDNTLSITDETTGSTIAFAVTSNNDGTISFSMGEQYGAATMSKCSSAEIVNALTQIVSDSAAAASTSDATAQAGQQ